MNLVKIDKVTLNIGVGAPGEKLENAKALLEKISGSKAVLTKAKTRNPTFKIRKGDDIGVKITLRKQTALDVLKRCLDAIDFSVSQNNFDSTGNVSFGVKEYIDVPGMRYDPKIGMSGFDVAVSLVKQGIRVQRRRIAFSRIPRYQRVSKPEAIEFMKSLGVILKEEEVSQ
ncbi:MAG: 50S ribosomal protein L5 [Candidatus Micrarchaeota archaeon]|nr:50S ribosomal protein L5 [Candidatus Micrarchaeota archaeon]